MKKRIRIQQKKSRMKTMETRKKPPIVALQLRRAKSWTKRLVNE